MIAASYGQSHGGQRSVDNTFTFTNAVPQIGPFNSGKWMAAEKKVVAAAKDCECKASAKGEEGRLYVVVGKSVMILWYLMLGDLKSKYVFINSEWSATKAHHCTLNIHKTRLLYCTGVVDSILDYLEAHVSIPTTLRNTDFSNLQCAKQTDQESRLAWDLAHHPSRFCNSTRDFELKQLHILLNRVLMSDYTRHSAVKSHDLRDS